MANWKLSDEKIDVLQRLNSTYRIKHRGGNGGIFATVVDLVTDEPYGEWVEGADEEDAVNKAIEAARGISKPMTPSQLVQRNKELEAELAALRGNTPQTPAAATNQDDEADEEEAPPSIAVAPPVKRRPNRIVGKPSVPATN